MFIIKLIVRVFPLILISSLNRVLASLLILSRFAFDNKNNGTRSNFFAGKSEPRDSFHTCPLIYFKIPTPTYSYIRETKNATRICMQGDS